MEPERRLENLRQRILQEVSDARMRNDQWLLIHLSTKQDGTISLSADSVFECFRDSRELRGPRWRTLVSAQEFSDVGFSWVIAGELSAYIIFRQLIAGNVPAGVIMHIDAVHRWAPKCAEIIPTVNSVLGFLNPEVSEHRGRGAKRPGRVTRVRLTSNGCRLCGSTENLTLHHLIPRKSGGATEEENLLSVCRSCHDAIHNGEEDVTDLVMEVSIKRSQCLLQNIKEQDEGRSNADEV